MEANGGEAPEYAVDVRGRGSRHSFQIKELSRGAVKI
jgi:hypothetical protein